MNDMCMAVAKAVEKKLPNSKIISVLDRGSLVHHHYQVQLESGETVFLKLNENPEWTDIQHEARVCSFFLENGLPAPKILAVDESRQDIPYPFIIQQKVGGTKLLQLLEQTDSTIQSEIYEEIGRFYRRMHSIKNEQSGLWGDNPRSILYPVSPNEYMFKANIIEGSGREALENGLISRHLYDKIIDLWQKNMNYLKDHHPCLVHVSPFLWNIYLEKNEKKWNVTKIMALGDVMWWDAAYDLAELQFPSFGQYDENRWQSFAKGYGTLPEKKRILLYALLQRICALMGVYMEPDIREKEIWKENVPKDLQRFIDEIEAM